MKTLIIEDDPKGRLLLEEQIRSFGHEVSACPDAETALNVCQQDLYQLIILDLGLPDMDGIELCRRIRELPQADQSMILVVTGRDEPGDLSSALEAGANDYLSKPVSLEQLQVRLTIIEQQFNNLIRRKHAETSFKVSLTQIERAKQEWESTADSLSHVVCLIDRHGHIIRANRAIEQWKLGRVEEVKGRRIHEIFHPDCSKSDCYLMKFLRKASEEVARGKSFEYEIEDSFLQRWLHFQIRPISPQTVRKSKAAESFAVLVASDITVQKQLQETLSKQDRLLLGVAGAMNYLLTIPDFQAAILRALKTLGLAVDADRVYIYENHTHPDTEEPLMSQRFEWDRFSRKAWVNNPGFQSIPYRMGFTRWYETLNKDETICGLVRELPTSEREMLDHQNIMSILVVPITIHDRFWGFIGFDDCHAERHWRYEEEAVLVAMAASIGGAIARNHMEEKLRQTSSELRAVFQSLPDEYFRLNANGSILDYKVNQGTELVNAETFIGQWASGILPEDVELQFDTAIEQVSNTKKVANIEYKLPVSDHRRARYEEIRLFPFLEDQLLGVARDITERKQAEEALRKQRDQLEQLVKEHAAELKMINEKLRQEIAKRKQAEDALRKLK